MDRRAAMFAIALLTVGGVLFLRSGAVGGEGGEGGDDDWGAQAALRLRGVGVEDEVVAQLLAAETGRFDFDASEIFSRDDVQMAYQESAVPLFQKRENGEDRLRLHHCPKTGGATLRADIAHIFHVERPRDREDCFETYYDSHHLNIGLFREPRSHALSQFMHCKYNNGARHKREPGSGYPFENRSPEGDVLGFPEWLGFFAADKWKIADGSYGCYNPIEFQARVMTCDYAVTGRNNHFIKDEKTRHPSLERAKANVLKLHWFGVLDLYDASLCVAMFQFNHKMAHFCDCKHRADRAHHSTLLHGVPPHSLHDHSPETLRLIDDITKVDKLLYEWSRDLLVQRIRHVENRTSLQLICE